MKKTCALLVFAVLPGIFYAQQEQRQVSTQPNGVIVHESAGNEGFIQPEQQQGQKVRTISDWNLAECIDAIRAIDEKLLYLTDSAADQQRGAGYLAYKQQVTERKDYLMNSQH